MTDNPKLFQIKPTTEGQKLISARAASANSSFYFWGNSAEINPATVELLKKAFKDVPEVTFKTNLDENKESGHRYAVAIKQDDGSEALWYLHSTDKYLNYAAGSATFISKYNPDRIDFRVSPKSDWGFWEKFDSNEILSQIKSENEKALQLDAIPQPLMAQLQDSLKNVSGVSIKTIKENGYGHALVFKECSTEDVWYINTGRVLFLTQFLVLIGKAYQYQGDAHGVRSVRLEGTGRDLSAVAVGNVEEKHCKVA